ncbi:hypothetical protein ACLOJK_037140 [Asimina triloba]
MTRQHALLLNPSILTQVQRLKRHQADQHRRPAAGDSAPTLASSAIRAHQRLDLPMASRPPSATRHHHIWPFDRKVQHSRSSTSNDQHLKPNLASNPSAAIRHLISKQKGKQGVTHPHRSDDRDTIG